MVTICYAKFWVNGQHWKAEIARVGGKRLFAPYIERIDDDSQIQDVFGIPGFFDTIEEILIEAIDLIENPY